MPRQALTTSLQRRTPATAKSLAIRGIVSAFHRLYYNSAARTWNNTRWLGVRVAKCPLDLWIYHELIVELRPDLVIETGTMFGGSALYLASCLGLVGGGRVITIDIQERSSRPVHDRIRYLTGSSVDPAIVAEVAREAAEASVVMVILDSDHSRQHVLAELQAYSPLVTSGSYLIVEDTNVNGHPVLRDHGPGPYEAIESFLAQRPPFVRDASREKFYLTFNPGGFLRRLDDADLDASGRSRPAG
jgi:cephalosporin hydroxylase